MAALLEPDPQTDTDEAVSLGSLSVLSGECLTVWGAGPASGDTDLERECALRLEPDRPAIVGRAEGSEVPYLDPAYRPTTVLPGTARTVLHSGGHGRDLCLSRGHFMLRATPAGILLVNGVPRRGGGMRPPVNGTRLLLPDQRWLLPGEEYVIEHGTHVVLWLPNGSEVRIDAL